MDLFLGVHSWYVPLTLLTLTSNVGGCVSIMKYIKVTINLPETLDYKEKTETIFTELQKLLKDNKQYAICREYGKNKKYHIHYASTLGS